MTDDPLNPLDQSLREAAWRRKLTDAEQQTLREWLAAHPEAQAEFEVETGLAEALERLPDPPLASNFTARVLQAVERETGSESPLQRPAKAWWRAWLLRVAFGGVAAALALAIVQHRENVRQKEYAESIAVIAEVTSLPAPEVLQDFEAIRALKTSSVLRSDPRKTTAAADEQLLTLLQ